MKAFISTTSFGEYSKEPLDLLRRNGIDYTLNTRRRRLREDEILNILKMDSYVGLIAGTEALTKDVLKGAEMLKVISRVGVGLDNVDLQSAKRENIRVYNTPSILTDSVAELTIALILSSLRKIVSVDRNMRSGTWKKEMGLLFRDKVLGIIGFGKIGGRVAQLANAFGAKTVFYDIEAINDNSSAQVSLEELLKASDIVAIHSSSKERLIGKNEISAMKPGAILINTSRGSAIDEDALYDAISSGRIASAALDVYNNEPYAGKLTGLENVILTPHIGSYAKEARIEMEIESVNNLVKGFREVGLL
ncbi:MAG: hydroxyacid dehydrogenase [Candidatus Omnitrophica bacterium]|nr:hydroxyacid dehydrogenase [Candidatus Omnitrophota bacterium]